MNTTGLILIGMPVLIPDFTFEEWKERGIGAFGSIGRGGLLNC